MDSSDFSDMPKETIMIIGDMDKFIEFIAFNSIRKAVYKIMFSLFDNQNYATKLIEKYVIRHNVSLRKFIETESEKYFVKNINDGGDDHDDTEGDFLKESGVAGQIKRGDIDRLVLKSTNDILFKILHDMTNDKLIKLCWDAETNDFVWSLRQVNEPDKIETKYVPKKKTKKTK